MRWIVLLLSALMLIAVGGGVLAWTQLTSFLESPSRAVPAEKIVTIPANSDAKSIAALLSDEGLIEKPEWMQFYVEHFARDIAAKPGEYALSPGMTPIDLVKKIQSGKVVTYTVTIPPGATIEVIAELLAEKKIADAAEFKALARDRKTAHELGVLSDNLEGFLFPEVYDLPKGLAPRAVLELFIARYRSLVTTGILDTARKNDLTEPELVTLASLIEKSNVLSSEQRTYSAMLHNRRKQKKPLEVAASLDYGLALVGLDLNRATKPEIKASEWNLSIIPGLPPWPICSPSLPAIVAASEPADSQVLFMVKRTDGTHVVCLDVECYNLALKEWPLPPK